MGQLSLLDSDSGVAARYGYTNSARAFEFPASLMPGCVRDDTIMASTICTIHRLGTDIG